ncbi:glycolate oxidase [Desulfobotulus alkaliphilus]|uniref:Glycolate oxidase n=1 Tax=Desulfobotulus alkaliphilus TaxID=622671 RepID=A0A562S8G1_9BACT|nr:FAD-linked oxidase C-terminal domain-containing protein [Desulfobotulus alkaliphilus]TWI77483.1 glycolate oxidase [Desulfobotulus alkaliphilus]
MGEKKLGRQVRESLRRAVGEKAYFDSEAERFLYSYDTSSRKVLPDAVVRAENAGQIAALMAVATRHGIPVTPRGGGSGTTGGSVPVDGGVVLVMSGMNRILSVDMDNLVARAEPGVITGDFHRAVEAKGLFYPPDPASAAFCTLGGNLAECAGGPRAVKYGVTRDYVLGLEAVLPTGEHIRTGVQTAKGVVGYDLTRLIVGSEGTLAVITAMTLKLLPLPESVKTLTVVFDHMARAAETVSEIIRQGLIPRTIEYMDQAAIACAETRMPGELPVDAGAMLIIEVDGKKAEALAMAEDVALLCHRMGAREVKVAATAEEAARLWAARKAISPALFRYGPHKINEDIVVPRSKIPDVVEKIRELKEKTRLMMVSFGHAGDGNIHFNIMLDKKDASALRRARWAVGELFRFTLAMGGTLSGEHGVGLSKQAYFDMEIGPEEKALMLRLKKAFDPAGILNPHKIF